MNAPSACAICAQPRPVERLVVTPTGRGICYLCAGPKLANVCREIDRLGVAEFVARREAYAAQVVADQWAL